MAFVVAGIVAVIAVGYWLLANFAAGMSDNPLMSDEVSSESNWIAGAGLLLAVVIASSHWWHFHW